MFDHWQWLRGNEASEGMDFMKDLPIKAEPGLIYGCIRTIQFIPFLS
ncbi:hypothetical protein OROMI_010608 [Orobanche minor]